MASPHGHDDDPACPPAGSGRRFEWMDFKLELHGDPEEVKNPLVRSGWEGAGFVGRCPSYGGWVRFYTLGLGACDDEEAAGLPHRPEPWWTVAQIT